MNSSRAALWTIALMLAADFSVEHVWPSIVLAMNDGEYLKASQACQEALSNLQDIQTIRNHVDPDDSRLLWQSAMVGTLDCYAKEDLRRHLLAQGISEHELVRLDLSARALSDSGLPYAVGNANLE